MLVKLGDKQNFKLYRSTQSDKSISLDFYEINKKTIFDSEYYSKLYNINRMQNKDKRKKKSDLLEEYFENHNY